MIAPVDVARAIAGAVPPGVGLPPIAPLPSLDAAAELARIVGGDPARLLGAADLLGADRGVIEDVSREAAELVARAGSDLLALGQRYVAEVSALLPAVAVPGGALPALARIAQIGASALADVEGRLHLLEEELHPLADRLDGMTAAAEAQPPLTPSPDAQRATGQLQALAGTGPSPDAPAMMEAAADSREITLPPEPSGEGEAAGSAVGRAAVEAAKSQLGAPYAWGGTGPGGFDCSGLTSWAYRQAGVELPRMAHEQAIGMQVSFDQLQPGDLAVWDGHVAMYAGDGMYIEAGDPVQMNPVRTDNIGMTFKGFWRPTG